MCASTLWPLSSSTLNMALGSGSSTVPSISIASSFGAKPKLFPLKSAQNYILCEPALFFQAALALFAAHGGQDFRSRLVDGDRLLEMRRQGTVFGDDGPAILRGLHVRPSHVDHWLQRGHHPRLQRGAGPGHPVVGHRRVLVHLPAYSVADEPPDHRESRDLGNRLYGAGDIPQPEARPARVDPGVQGVSRHLDQ